MEKGWLFDDTINAVMYLLKQRDNDTCFMDTFTFEALFKTGTYNYRSLRKLKSKNTYNFALYGKAIVPVNWQKHWFLLVACIPERRIEYVHHTLSTANSVSRFCLSTFPIALPSSGVTTPLVLATRSSPMASSDSSTMRYTSRCVVRTRICSQNACVYFCGASKVNACHGGLVAANFQDWEVAYPSAPQQENTVDCGVFTCYFANYISANATLDFSQEDIPVLRRRLTLDILRAEIV